MTLRVWVVGDTSEAGRHATAWGKSVPSVTTLSELQPGTLPWEAGAPDDARVVSVCVPLDERAEAVRRCLSSGADVLVPSPAASDAEEARALADLAQARARRLVPAHPLAYTPGQARLMALVRERRLGAVQNVFSYRFGPRSPLLPYEYGAEDEVHELASHAAAVKQLCLYPEARVSDVALSRDDAGLQFQATMRYDDDILATVRIDPAITPARRGLMVTLWDGVLRWEVGAEGEYLELLKGLSRRRLDVPAEDPYVAMVTTLARAATNDTPPYEDGEAVARTAALLEAWK